MKHKTPSPREAVAIADQLAQLRTAGQQVDVQMTAPEFAEFKKQLWWGRELFTPLGVMHLFPGVGTRKPIKPVGGVTGARPPAPKCDMSATEPEPTEENAPNPSSVQCTPSKGSS